MESKLTVFTKLNFYILWIIAINPFVVQAYNTSDEISLIENLFSGYLNYVIPRENSNVPLNVSINPFILLIDKVDVKRQTFAARIYFELTWTDKLLIWRPERYSGIEKIHVPYSMVWTPDVCIAGDLGDYTDIGKAGTVVVVHNTGLVVFWPTKMFEITCVVEIQNYPFDEQSCEIDLSSWAFDDKFMKMVAANDSINVDMLTPSGEWQVVKQFAFYKSVEHADMRFDHVIFPFRLRRRWQFIMLNTFFPTLCTSLLSLLCFCLPNESGERVGLSISIFLTLAVFMTVTSGKLPETANAVSLLGAYVALQLAWSGMTILLTVISLVIACKDNSQTIPTWLHALAKPRDIRGESNNLKECTDESTDRKTDCKRYIMRSAMLEGTTEVNTSTCTWGDVAKLVNMLCFFGGLIFQLCLNLWFLIRATLK